MGKKTYGTVIKSFHGTADRTFADLVADLDLHGPEHHELVMPGVSLVGAGVRYSVLLDTEDMTIHTYVKFEQSGSRFTADIEAVVAACDAEISARSRHDARTLSSLETSLESQVQLVRLVHPMLTTAGGAGIMRQANARERQS